jgi:hypothetical protein
MSTWAVVLPADRYEAERLFANETVALPGPGPAGGGPGPAGGGPGPAGGGPGPAPGDGVLLLAGGALFGLGRVRSAPGDGGPVVAYTHRLIDEPVPADGLDLGGPGVYPVDAATFEAYAGKVGAELRVDATKRTWLVSVDLPIEAYSAPEAVRAFWSYVYQLGPRELPAFVAPSDDELAMQAFVLGAETNLDPEEDED